MRRMRIAPDTEVVKEGDVARDVYFIIHGNCAAWCAPLLSCHYIRRFRIDRAIILPHPDIVTRVNYNVEAKRQMVWDIPSGAMFGEVALGLGRIVALYHLLILFIPESLTYLVPLFLKRQCDRTPGRAASWAHRGRARRAAAPPHGGLQGLRGHRLHPVQNPDIEVILTAPCMSH
jgi:hypothetical protein